MKKVPSRFVLLFLLFGLLYFPVFPQENNGIYIDEEGFMRWNENHKKAFFFGVNYAAPFAFGYRHIKARGMDLEKAIEQDVYHLARMGVNAFRIHVFDTEITDAQGNIKDNEHLRLFDYLIAELEKRKIKIILTPIAFWGNGYPEEDTPTDAFSYRYGKLEALVNKKAWQAQENYLNQFFSRKNRYTGKVYYKDPSVIAAEINNEPQHSGAKKKVTKYIDRMIQSVRSTGWDKPIFYNISESPQYADAVVQSKANGYTFQWYPSGLVAGRTQQGNFLPHVSKYNIPFDTIPGFEKGAKMVYEFESADIEDSYVYPEIAKSFRNAGFQWATLFAYDPMALADVNTEYQTHYLNLAYTPSKAISFMIAGQVFKEDSRAEISYEHSRSELVEDTLFYYSNSSKLVPPRPEALKHIAGVGRSPVVNYTGSGAYFLDKLASGIWRLEIMPDVIPLSDPFAKASPQKKVRGIEWNAHTMNIRLPNLGKGYSIAGINKGNSVQSEAREKAIQVSPGAYILRATAKKSFPLSDKQKMGDLEINEFVTPKPDKAEETKIHHRPPRTLSTGSPVVIKATASGVSPTDSLTLTLYTTHRKSQKLKMERKGSEYAVALPDNTLEPGVLRYYISVYQENRNLTFPGKREGLPSDWDFYSNEAYEIFVNHPEAGITLFDPKRDRNNLNFYSKNWKENPYSFVAATEESDKLGLESWVTSSGNEKENFTDWQVYVGDLIQNRKQDLKGFKTLKIKVKSNRRKASASIALITKEGNSYTASFKLNDHLSTISVPLKDLQQKKMFLLPRPYPGFQPFYYDSKEKKKFNLHDVERVGIRFPAESAEEESDESRSMTIFKITLE